MDTALLFVFPVIVYIVSGIVFSILFLPKEFKDRAIARFLLVFGWPIIFLLALVTIPYLYITKGNVENW